MLSCKKKIRWRLKLEQFQKHFSCVSVFCSTTRSFMYVGYNVNLYHHEDFHQMYVRICVHTKYGILYINKPVSNLKLFSKW